MPVHFEILAEDAASHARAGLLHTPHGSIETPVFMPVGTGGTVKGLTQETLESLAVKILLANTYHLYLRPGHELIRAAGGLHRFMSWPRAILTDSGGFQVMSLKSLRQVTEDGVRFRSHLDGSSHFLSPERAVEIQLALGADIIMALDECVEYPASHETLQRSVALTTRWAERAKRAWGEARGTGYGARDSGTGTRDTDQAGARGMFTQPDVNPRCQIPDSEIAGGFPEPENPNPQSRVPSSESGRSSPDSRVPYPVSRSPSPALFGIVQGGTDKDLRRASAEALLDLDFEGYALGGLAVGEPKSEMYDTAEFTAGLLPRDRPRYLMGVGTPGDLVEGVARGLDMFDCVMPTRNARNACAFTSTGKISLRNARYARDEGPLDPACRCGVCQRYSRAYLRHLFMAGEMLGAILATQHNLHFYLDTMHEIRQSLLFGKFPEFQSKVRARP